GADLTNARLDGAFLVGTILHGATLTGASLTDAYLSGGYKGSIGTPISLPAGWAFVGPVLQPI
ncbi:MAG: hypothetical protein F2749_11230, partial [Actinobacteria bacterium]|nr:hypothetical protein [Actinomycetota bacterium]